MHFSSGGTSSRHARANEAEYEVAYAKNVSTCIGTIFPSLALFEATPDRQLAG